ncbi:unannotated protein [freshwater metagenome]|uniref:Unannotated protein n=1 Tax=freshwater metagenome TaxID=449393 RepID=A0A6J7CHZ5_9ZZZZ
MKNGWIATVVGGAAIGVLAVGAVAMINNTSSTPHDTTVSAVSSPTTSPGGTSTDAGVVKRSITVSGHGKVTIKPDTATLSLGISVTAGKANDALRQAATKADTLVKVLTSAGVSKDDIQTSGLYLYPQYAGDGRTISGYNASNTMTVTIRKIADTGTIIDAAGALIGNEVTVGGISFSLANTDAAMADARKAAVADAKLRADQYAGAAQASVGQVLTISEVSSPTTPIYYQSGDKATSGGVAPTPVLPGTQDVTVDVTVVFELK